MNLQEFRKYHHGEVLNLHWDRGNGELYMKYILCGFNRNNLPLLVHYSLISNGNPVFFDIEKMGKYIEEVEQADLKPIESGIISKILKHSCIN